MNYLVYVAGKLTADSKERMEAYRQEAKAFGAEVRRATGCRTFIPHVQIEEDPHLDGEALWGQCMEDCLLIMSRCDAVIFMPNWTHSRGARVERLNARAWGIPIADSIPSLKRILGEPA